MDGTPRIATAPLQGWPLVLLGLVYLLSGLIGHDPWKNDDALNFGIVLSFLEGRDWLLPHLAGETWLESPPLYHWCAALLARAMSGLLSPPDAARLCSGLFGALFLYLLAGASRSLHGNHGGPTAVLVAIGCLGLLAPLHETQPASAVLAAGAAGYWGLVRLPERPRSGGLLLGCGVGAGFLVSGLDSLAIVVPLALLAALAPRWRSGASRRGFAIATAAAVPLCVLWPALLAWQAPDALPIWWSRELASLRPSGAASFAELAELLAWAAWPALPLALWSLWRGRRRLFEAAIALPLAGTLIAATLLVALHEARPIHVLPLLLPLTLLAGAGAATLRRGAANAFDWFGMMTFTLVAALVWLGGIAMVAGIPSQIEHNFAKLAPGFVARFDAGAWTLAALLTLAWCGHLWRAPRSPWRALTHWAGGVTLMWALLAALWFPWVDYGKSYRGVALELKSNLGGEACIAGRALPDALRASLDYFAGVITIRAGQPGSDACPLLLEQGSADRDASPAGWMRVWEGHRPGDKDERLRLYRRDAAIAPGVTT